MVCPLRFYPPYTNGFVVNATFYFTLDLYEKKWFALVVGVRPLKKMLFLCVSSLSGSNTKKLYDPLPPAGSPRSSRAGWPGGLEPAQSPVHRPMSSLRHTAQ